MLIEIIIFTVFGIAIGTATGLLPGLHPNTILLIILSSVSIFSGFPVYAILSFIVSMAITNTFVDFIPSLIFGAPEEGAELSVLPGHEMVLSGRAYEALFLTVVGGIGVVLLTILTFPLLLQLLPFLYNNVSSYIHYLLIFVVLWAIISENRIGIVYACLIFFLSGSLGLISLSTFPSISIFPALTGLFGVSGLIVSLRSKTTIPEQKEAREVDVSIKGIFTGWFSGLLVGILPGIGSSQAGVMASNIFKTNKRDFLTSIGGINTANILFTFISFFTLDKIRSGAAAAISQVLPSPTFHDVIIIVIVGVITTFIAALVTLKAGKLIIMKVEKLNYQKINLSILTLLVVLVIIFSGPVGLIILVTSTFMGLLTIHLKIRRSHMMGFFLLPTILYFAGLNAPLSIILGI